MHALVEKLAEQFDDSRPHPGKPTRQRIRPQQEQAARFGFLQRLAHAAGVTAHQVQLQLPRLCRLNVFGGASGDLAPLAHVALALIGEDEVVFRRRRLSAAAAL